MHWSALESKRGKCIRRLVAVTGMGALGAGASVLDVGPFGLLLMLFPEIRDWWRARNARRSDIGKLKLSQKNHVSIIMEAQGEDKKAEPELPLDEITNDHRRREEEEDGR